MRQVRSRVHAHVALPTTADRTALVHRPRVLPKARQQRRHWHNNRAESSHQPTRERERRMRRYKSPEYSQQFLSIHSGVSSHFRPRRHPLVRADTGWSASNVSTTGTLPCRPMRSGLHRNGHRPEEFRFLSPRFLLPASTCQYRLGSSADSILRQLLAVTRLTCNGYIGRENHSQILKGVPEGSDAAPPGAPASTPAGDVASVALASVHRLNRSRARD